MWSERIKKAALEESFLLKAPLFPPFFPSSSIGEKKFDKIFINTWPLANNHAKEKVNISIAGCGGPLAGKLNKPWQIEFLEWRPAYIVETIPLTAVMF